MTGRVSEMLQEFTAKRCFSFFGEGVSDYFYTGWAELLYREEAPRD
jgi:hypothetical protein